MKQSNRNDSLRWNPRFLVLCCILQFTYGLLSMGFALIINLVANTAASAENVSELLSVGLIAVLFALLYPFSRLLADGTMQTYAERAAQTVRCRLNRSIFSMDSAEFAKKDTGEYLNTLTSDVLLLRDQYYTQVPLIFSYAAQFVFCVIYSILLNPVVAALMMVLSVVQYFVPMLFGKKINRLTVVQSRQTASFTSKAKELLLGFSVVKSYGGERSVQGEFDEANQTMTNARLRTQLMTQLMMKSNLLIALMMVLLSVLAAGWFVVKGSMTPATLLTVFYIANRFSMPVMDFAATYTQIKGSRGMRERLGEFLAAHPELPPQKAAAVQQGIEVRNLNFSYSEDAPAIRDFSYFFEKGKKYLLLGESGCGKSTLLKVLAGQYPSHGVYVDGKPLESLPAGSLAGHLVLVGQQPYVFRRSVADNIDFLGVGDRTRIEREVKRCCLSEFIASLPQGVDTMVDEEQRQLSGGQKARIGLARALYTKPDILLLDEVTSALDPETARTIEETLLTLEDITIIHISHKPSPELTSRYDGVLTMENGRLI